MNNTLTALKGVKVGHSTHPDKLTGCTVIVFDTPYLVSYQSNGGAARTYDTNIMDDGKSYPRKHAIYISDGGHAGLETAAFVAKGLREKNIGWKIGKSTIPSITGACVLTFGIQLASFNPEYGYEAIQNVSQEPVANGNIGAGTGTMVGKFSYTKDGLCLGMKAGIGSSRINLGNNMFISALSVVNALGNIINKDGTILAGNRNDKGKFRNFEETSSFLTNKLTNTTISIVGTNIKLSHEDLRKVAQIATHGQIRAVYPVNTSIDGDTVFAFTTEEKDMYLNSIGKSISKSDWYKISIDIIAQTAAKAVQESIYDACYKAETIKFKDAYKGIIPSVKDYK